MVGTDPPLDCALWVPVPGNVQLHTVADVAVLNCTFEHLGMTALVVDNGSQAVVVANNTFRDVSCGGVQVGQVDDLNITDPTRWNGFITVFNNLFDGIPVEYHDCAALLGGYLANSTFSHNDVLGAANTGISLGWGWDRESSPAAHGNGILANFVNGSNWLLEDGGSIYTLGPQPGSEFAYNFMSDQVKLFGSIYHDEGSAYWHTHHNVVNNGPEWLHIWTTSIHDIVVDDCWTNQNYSINDGTNITIFNITYLLPTQLFPGPADAIIQQAGRLGAPPKNVTARPWEPRDEPAPQPRCRYCGDPRRPSPDVLRARGLPIPDDGA